MSTPPAENRDWSIQEIARLAGTTSRTLRHYGDVGLLHPSRVGSNGYRYYDAPALARLQRILMLRDLGLGIPAIADVLDGQRDDGLALATHLHWLREEKQRLDRQIASVETTISKMRGGENLMAEEMFDGFDHTVYRAEVEEKWGADAYRQGSDWFAAMTTGERAEWMQRQKQLATDWAAAAERGVDAKSPEARALVERHVAWLASIPGTPSGPEYVRALGDLYVEDPRFAANYGGADGARFVRDALHEHVN